MGGDGPRGWLGGPAAGRQVHDVRGRYPRARARALAGRRAGRPRDGRRGLAAGRAPHRCPARGRDSARAAARREGPPPAPVRAERGEPAPLPLLLWRHARRRLPRRPAAVPRPVGCALRRLQAALRHARRPAHSPGGEAAPLPRWEGRGRVETAPRAPRRRRARRLLALRGRALDRADQRLRRRSGGDSAGQQRSASRPQPARARLLAERHPLLPLLGIGTAALRPAEGAGQTPARLCRAQLPSVHLQPPQLARAHLRAAVAAMWPAAPARRRRV
mmetsp:Transcript_18667/g.58808  ORF Transcript_18667/g.58808 Transcript_18667/m.58808 type:complete len:275 (+) Transcript_18667:801-1625(+)